MKYLFFILIFIQTITAVAQDQNIVWETNSRFVAPGGYPRMAELNDSSLLLGADFSSNGVSSIEIQRSDDKGEHWYFWSRVVAENRPNYHVANTFLLPTKDGRVLCGIRRINNVDAEDANGPDGIIDYRLELFESKDAGRNWNFVSTIVNNQTGVWEPFLIENSKGQLLAFYANELSHNGPNQNIEMRKSLDGGKTWGASIIVSAFNNSREGMPGVINYGNDQMAVVFESADTLNNNYFDIKLRTSQDGGDTWSIERTLVYRAPKATFAKYGSGAPYIVAGNDGRWIVSFQANDIDAADKNMYMAYVESFNEGLTWSAPQKLFGFNKMWNSLFVPSSSSVNQNIWALTSGVEILKGVFKAPNQNLAFTKLENLNSHKCVMQQNLADGDHSIQYDCSNQAGQDWVLEKKSENKFLIRNAQSGKCLDLDGGSRNLGAVIQQWNCHGGENQQWSFVKTALGLQLVSVASNLCIDVDAWSKNNKAPLIQWTCHGGANQIFQLNPMVREQFKIFPLNTKLEVLHSHMCLSQSNNSLGNRTIQKPCTDSTLQSWQIEKLKNNFYQFKNVNTGKCLDVDGWKKDPGTSIIQWECRGTENQQWNIVSTKNGLLVVSAWNNLCLDMGGWSTKDNAPLIQWNCHAGANQTFRIKNSN